MHTVVTPSLRRRTSRISRAAICVAFALLVPATSAYAAVIFEFQRLSDTTATLTATGTLTGSSCPEDCNVFLFSDIYATDPTFLQSVAVSSSLAFGATPINFAYTAPAGYLSATAIGTQSAFYIGNGASLDFNSNSSPTGSMTLSFFPGTTLLPGGSFGNVYWGPELGAAAVGTWSITDPAAVPAPEPASMLLLGTGLLGAGVRRWRQKRA